MQIINAATARAVSHIKAAIYSPGGHRKTWLATEVPEEWGRIVYIAADMTSPSLSSVRPETRERMYVVVPDGNAERGKDGRIVKTSWLKEAYEMSQREWTKEFPDAGVLIWDTMTQTSEEILRENARKNWFSDKGPVTGSNNPAVDPEQKYALPQPGDFNMAQQSGLMVVEYLVRQPLHVICLFQETMSEASARNGEGLLFGPATVGQKGPRQIPNKFNFVAYLTIDQGKGTTNTGDTIVHLIPEAYHTGRCNTSRVADVPAVKQLGKDLDGAERRALWNWVEMMTTTKGDTK